jgi:coatomer subunit beta'
VFWSGTGNLVAVAADDSYYVLKFDRDAYQARVDDGAELTDEGVEEAFEVVAEIPDGYVLHVSIYAYTPLTWDV